MKMEGMSEHQNPRREPDRPELQIVPTRPEMRKEMPPDMIETDLGKIIRREERRRRKIEKKSPLNS